MPCSHKLNPRTKPRGRVPRGFLLLAYATPQGAHYKPPYIQGFTVMARVIMAMKIDPKLKEELRREAEKDNRSMSNLVELAIRNLLEERKDESAKH